MVICVDEKPSIQALGRAQGWLKLPNEQAVTGFSHEYKRNGISTLFAALEVATGRVEAGHYRRRLRREFLDFMNELVTGYGPETKLHVVLDNLGTHKPKHDCWLACHPNVNLHFTPTHASWLNQIEVWFSILSHRLGAERVSVQHNNSGWLSITSSQPTIKKHRPSSGPSDKSAYKAKTILFGFTQLSTI